MSSLRANAVSPSSFYRSAHLVVPGSHHTEMLAHPLYRHEPQFESLPLLACISQTIHGNWHFFPKYCCKEESATWNADHKRMAKPQGGRGPMQGPPVCTLVFLHVLGMWQPWPCTHDSHLRALRCRMHAWLLAKHGEIGGPAARFPPRPRPWAGGAAAGAAGPPGHPRTLQGPQDPLTWCCPGSMRRRGEGALGCCGLCTCPGTAGGKGGRAGSRPLPLPQSLLPLRWGKGRRESPGWEAWAGAPLSERELRAEIPAGCTLGTVR